MTEIKNNSFRLGRTLAAIAFVLGLFSLLPAQAEEAQASPPPVQEDNWYWYLSSGIGRPNYDADFERDINDQKRRGGNSHYAAHFDLPGFYRNFGKGLLGGLVLNGMLEHVAKTWREQDSLAFHIWNTSLSAFYFKDQVPGNGFFVRADIGHSRLIRIWELNGRYRSHFNGVFYQAGIGYGWQASKYSRLLVHLNQFYADYGGGHYIHGPALYVGFLL